jgi:MFS family permease
MSESTESSTPSGGGAAVIPDSPAGPQQRVSWVFIAALCGAYFLFMCALLGPGIVGLAIKVQSIVPAAEKAPALGVVSAFSAVVATLSNVIFGRISDRTTWRFGRRRPWIVIGTVAMGVGLLGTALSPTVPILIVTWCVVQFGANVALSPFNAILADFVPHEQRGAVAALKGIAINLAVMSGTYMAKFFTDNLVALFFGPAVLAFVAVVAYAWYLPEKQLTLKPPKATFKEILSTFYFNPVKFPDFGWAWLSRFTMQLSTYMFTTFRLFYMQDEIGLTTKDAAAAIATGVLIYTLISIPASYISGKLSDVMGRRKIFVLAASIIFGAGTVLLFNVNTVMGFYMVEAILGLAYGIYLGVDLALVIDVLPDPRNPGKDLGVFNIANALPNAAAPLIGAQMLAIASPDSKNYAALVIASGVIAIVGGFAITLIKKVR